MMPNRVLYPDNLWNRVEVLENKIETLQSGGVVVSQLAALSSEADLGDITAGNFYSGTGTPGVDFTGGVLSAPGYYDAVTARHYVIYTLNAGVLQCGLSTEDGAFIAGAGKVYADVNGIAIQADTGWYDANAYKFVTGTTVLGGLYTSIYGGNNTIRLATKAVAGMPGVINVQAYAPNSSSAQVALSTYVNTTYGGGFSLLQISDTADSTIVSLYGATFDIYPITTFHGLYTMLEGGSDEVKLLFDAPAGKQRTTVAYSNVGGTMKARWQWGVFEQAETGSDAGSDFMWMSYDDAGNYLDTPIYIQRASSAVQFSGNVILAKAGALLYVGADTGQNAIALNGPNSSVRDISWQTAGVYRWILRANTTSESGSDAGSDFQIISRHDDGSPNIVAMTIYRNTGAISFGPNVSIIGSTSCALNISGAAGYYRQIVFRTSGSARWVIGANSTGEGGSDAGTTLVIKAYTDAGVEKSTPLTISRATGDATFGANVTVTAAFGCNGKTAQTAYASGGALAAYGSGAYGLDSAAHMQGLYNLVVAMRAALVANGTMS